MQMGVVAKLGEATNIPVQLQLQTLSETIEVRADAASAVFSPSHAGAATSIAPEAIQELPTISRSITDLVRTSPYVNPTSQGSDAGLQIAGRNNRYNNMQIDGAVNNDVFGIAATGTPGGQTGTQPVSLDAIQEIQVLVSPYDVRQGGFSGGGVNAITKSGTNELHGSGFIFFRNLDSSEITLSTSEAVRLNNGVVASICKWCSLTSMICKSDKFVPYLD